MVKCRLFIYCFFQRICVKFSVPVRNFLTFITYFVFQVGKLDHGAISNLTLILYGTKEMPKHYEKERMYDMEYNMKHDRRKVKLVNSLNKL